MLGDEVENELQREGTATRTVMSSSTSLTKVASGPTGPTGGDSDKDDKGLGEGRSGRPKEDNDTVVVGFAFMAKKIDSMAKVCWVIWLLPCKSVALLWDDAPWQNYLTN